MSDASLANQKKILARQDKIMANQKRIVRNQQTIIANQKKILANQAVRMRKCAGPDTDLKRLTPPRSGHRKAAVFFRGACLPSKVALRGIP